MSKISFFFSMLLISYSAGCQFEFYQYDFGGEENSTGITILESDLIICGYSEYNRDTSEAIVARLDSDREIIWKGQSLWLDDPGANRFTGISKSENYIYTSAQLINKNLGTNTQFNVVTWTFNGHPQRLWMTSGFMSQDNVALDVTQVGSEYFVAAGEINFFINGEEFLVPSAFVASHEANLPQIQLEDWSVPRNGQGRFTKVEEIGNNSVGFLFSKKSSITPEPTFQILIYDLLNGSLNTLIDLSDFYEVNDISADKSKNLIYSCGSEIINGVRVGKVVCHNDNGTLLWNRTFSDKKIISDLNAMQWEEGQGLFLTGYVSEDRAHSKMLYWQLDEAGNSICHEIWQSDFEESIGNDISVQDDYVAISGLVLDTTRGFDMGVWTRNACSPTSISLSLTDEPCPLKRIGRDCWQWQCDKSSDELIEVWTLGGRKIAQKATVNDVFCLDLQQGAYIFRSFDKNGNRVEAHKIIK